MVTTIQITEKTLQILKKMKQELNTLSYDQTISCLVSSRLKENSLAGYLRKKNLKFLLKDVRKKKERI